MLHETLEVVTEPPEGLKLNIKQLEAQHSARQLVWYNFWRSNSIKFMWFVSPRSYAKISDADLDACWALGFFIQKMIRCVSLSWQGGRECLSHTRLAWELPPVDVCSCLLPCSGPGDWQHKRQFKGDWWGGYFTNRKFKGVDCVARTAESLGELDGTLHMTSMSQTSRLTWLNRYRFTAKVWSSSQPVDWLLVRLFDCWKVSAQLLNLYLQKSYDKGEAWVVCWPASAALVCFYLQFILWPIGPAVGDAPLPHWRSHVPFL